LSFFGRCPRSPQLCLGVPALFDQFLPIRDPLASFWVVMLIICFAPLAATRFRLPSLAGTMLVAALMGPSAFNLLERNETIELLGSAGLLYLVFVAALTLDLKQFLAQKYRSIAFGLLSFLIPFLLAFDLSQRFLDFGPAAALLLSSILGTHTLVAQPIAQGMGLGRQRAVVMAIGGTILTDALGLICLAGVVRSETGSADLISWITFGVILFTYLVVVLAGVPRLGRWFFRRFPNQPQVELAFVLSVLFGVAILSEQLGLAAIVGAFLTGLAMNRLIPETGPFMSRIVYFGESLFIPFFLVSVGLLIDFRVIFGSPMVLLLAALFMLILFTGKALAAAAAGGLFRFHWREMLLVLGLTTPQAAATLAVTLVGYDQLGLFDERIVNAVVVLILASCVAGSFVVDRVGRRVAATSEIDSDEIADRPDRVLVPLANPETAEKLVSAALAMRDDTTIDPLYLLAIAQSGPNAEASVAAAESVLKSGTCIASAAGVPVQPQTRIEMNVVDGIHRAAVETRASILVVGWHPRTEAHEIVLGGFVERLINGCGATIAFSRLLGPVERSQRVLLVIPPEANHAPGFRQAVLLSLRVAKRLRKPLRVIARPPEEAATEAAVRSAGGDIESVPLERWADVVPICQEMAVEGDLVILLSARRGTLPASASLARLPGLLARRLPKVNLIVLYPPSESAYSASARADLADDGARSSTMLQMKL
jgi:Kef-type K+ transport system membrane component KefB/nucleotide-binding universal stress UspA family protein